MKLAILLDNMYETMIAADGVGLAAPQIGVSQQIAIIDIEEEELELIELINPEIISQSGEEIDIEGCLSFPGLYGKVPRSSFVSVQAFMIDLARNLQSRPMASLPGLFSMKSIICMVNYLHRK